MCVTASSKARHGHLTSKDADMEASAETARYVVWPCRDTSARQHGRSNSAVVAAQPYSLGLALLSAQGVSHLRGSWHSCSLMPWWPRAAAQPGPGAAVGAGSGHAVHAVRAGRPRLPRRLPRRGRRHRLRVQVLLRRCASQAPSIMLLLQASRRSATTGVTAPRHVVTAEEQNLL